VGQRRRTTARVAGRARTGSEGTDPTRKRETVIPPQWMDSGWEAGVNDFCCMKGKRIRGALAVLLVGSSLLIESCGPPPAGNQSAVGKDGASSNGTAGKSPPSTVIAPSGLKGMTIEQVRALDKAALDKLPVYEVLLLSWTNRMDKPDLKKASAQLAFTVKSALQELYYDVDLWSADGIGSRKFKDSVREFQGKLKEPQTGILTWGQFEKAQAFGKAFHVSEVLPGGFAGISDYGDYTGRVAVRGTLKIVGDEISTPINVVKGIADKATMTYRQWSASISTDDMAILDLSETEYRIIEWGAEEIVGATEYYQRNEKVIINRKTEKVSFILTEQPPKSGKDGKPERYRLEPLKEPRLSTLVEGLDAGNAYYEKLRASARPYLSDKFLDAFGK